MQGQRTKSKSRLLHWQAERTRLQAKLGQLQAEFTRLQSKDAQWQAERKQLTQQLEAAQEEGQQSRRSLGLNSGNSGKPPSSDGPAKPPASQRRRTGRRSGGPERAPVQYGSRLAATAVYFQNAHFLPEERLTQLLRDGFGVSLCPGTLNNLRRRAAEAWEACVERIREHLIRCPGVEHLDEIGSRVGGRGQWLHGLSDQLLTYYRISEKRGVVGAARDPGARSLGSVIPCAGCPARAVQCPSLARVRGPGEDRRGSLGRADAAFSEGPRRVAERARKRGEEMPPQMLERMERRYDELV